jgi:hypothetical protein
VHRQVSASALIGRCPPKGRVGTTQRWLGRSSATTRRHTEPFWASLCSRTRTGPFPPVSSYSMVPADSRISRIFSLPRFDPACVLGALDLSCLGVRRKGVAISWNTDRIPALCQTFLAFDHWTFGSTKTFSSVTGSFTSKWAARD